MSGLSIKKVNVIPDPTTAEIDTIYIKSNSIDLPNSQYDGDAELVFTTNSANSGNVGLARVPTVDSIQIQITNSISSLNGLVVDEW